MTDYKNGKIYKIECQETNRIYIGSTCQPTIAGRLRGHMQKFRAYQQGKKTYTSSFCILETDNYKCLLVCNYPCNTKDELTAKEAEYIRQYKNDDMYECVNIFIPRRTVQEYYQDNKEKIIGKKKQYYEDNKEKIGEYRKQYTTDNKEKIAEYKKQYRTDNKEKIKGKRQQYRQTDKQKVSHTCECGGKFKINDKARHERTKKHIKWMTTK